MNLTEQEIRILMALVSKVNVPQTVDGKGDKDLATLREIYGKLQAGLDAMTKKKKTPS